MAGMLGEEDLYGPSVIYMVSELIRQWSETGEGVVIHTPAYDAFYKAIEGNQRTVMPVALEKQADDWFCDMGKLEAVLAKPDAKMSSALMTPTKERQ